MSTHTGWKSMAATERITDKFGHVTRARILIAVRFVTVSNVALMEGATSPVSTFETPARILNAVVCAAISFLRTHVAFKRSQLTRISSLFLHVVIAKPRDTFARHALAAIVEILRRGSRRAQLIDHNLVAENSHTPFRVVRAVDLSGI